MTPPASSTIDEASVATGVDACSVPSPVDPESPADRSTPAMDPQLRTIQPGGGVVMSMELAWGRFRRGYLRKFRPRYTARMLDRRQGTAGDVPIDPVDPRDMKFYANQDSYWWADADNPFLWRDSLPFVRAGLAELIVMGGGFLALAVVSGSIWWPLALPPLVLAGLIAWFFRNPRREVPQTLGTVVSPADGKLVAIEEIDDPELGRCIRLGIFLSIFNVHVNRAALPGRVVRVRYRPGKMLNALRPESARENENLDVDLECPGLQQIGLASSVIRVRQITGAFARRIVCWARVGDVLTRGEVYGMIKLGSRTELTLPADERLRVVAKLGDKVQAGSTVVAQYEVDQPVEAS